MTTITQLFDEDPKLNGLKCPVCKSPLLDSSPNMIFTSMPAQKAVNCTKCNYKGYRRL